MTLAPSPELKLSLMVDAVARGVTATGGGVGELAFSMDSNFRLLIVDTIRFRREREREIESFVQLSLFAIIRVVDYMHIHSVSSD